jgi:hypothetical protein
MKTMGRDIIKFHYKELSPHLENCHNSSQREQVIAENVKALIEGSSFLQGPPDANVYFFFMNDQSTDAS